MIGLTNQQTFAEPQLAHLSVALEVGQSTLHGTRFGTIQFAGEDVVVFPQGLVGLSELQRFIVICQSESSPFRWLQSCDEPGFALLVTRPENYIEGYDPEIHARVLGDIDLGNTGAHLVFVTATIPSGRPQEMTLNLKGPILINAERRLAVQCVLDDETYTTKYRVFSQSKAGEGSAA